MNKNINVKFESRIIKEMQEELLNNITEKALTTRDINTYETVKALKANKNTIIELNHPSHIIMALARLGYVAGSMVGIITNLIEVSGVLMSNVYNTQFMKEDGTVDLIKLRKVFPHVGALGNNEGYAPIFTEDNLKVFLVETKTGRQIRLVKALKSDIAKFVEQIENSNKFTQEDLVRIGKDLEQIGRVMQELEIDSAKDITVKEGMKEITEFMSAYTCKLSSKKMIISDNFDEIISNHKADEKYKKDIEFKYAIDEFLSLDKVYEEAAKEFELFVNANPDASDEELNKTYDNLLSKCINKSLIIDSATILKEYMVKHQANFLNKLTQMYQNSNMRLFESFLVLGINKDTAAIDEVKHLAVIACEMINNNFKYGRYPHETLANNLRNAIYTLGEAKGFTPEETFRIACHAGWFARYGNQITKNNNYRYTAISMMFTNELKWHFNADAMYTAIEVEIPDNFAIAPNTPFYMENGECEVELEDGSTDFMFCTKEDDYTGIVIAKVINGEAMFVKYVNEYEFEPVEFIIFDNICDLTQAANCYNANDISHDQLENTVTTIVETNTSEMNAAEKQLAEEADAERLQKTFNLWSNAIESSIRKRDRFVLCTYKINGGQHISIKRKTDSASRMLGRISHVVKSAKISEYNSIDTFVCAKGAIAILG